MKRTADNTNIQQVFINNINKSTQQVRHAGGGAPLRHRGRRAPARGARIQYNQCKLVYGIIGIL